MEVDDINDILTKKIRNKNEKANIESSFYYDYKLKTMPIKITIAYILSGGLWILFSNRIINMFIENKSLIASIQHIKGWIYMLITSPILYILINKFSKKSKIWSNKIKRKL